MFKIYQFVWKLSQQKLKKYIFLGIMTAHTFAEYEAAKTLLELSKGK